MNARIASDPVDSWLADAPSHWPRSLIGHFTKTVSLRNRSELPLLSVVRDLGVIERSDTDDNHNAIPEDLSNYKVVAAGQLVLNKMKTWQGSLGVSPIDGIVSPAYIVCQLHGDHHPRFIHYLLRSHHHVHAWRRISYGVRTDQWDMRYEDFRRVPAYLPPRAEQDAIVTFLDQKEREIAEYIATKQRMIEVLEEHSSLSVRHEVFGLKHQAKDSVPSELSYLPRVPRGWQVCRVKDEFRLLNHRRIPLSSEQRGQMKNRVFDYYGASGVIDKVDNYLFDEPLLLVAEDGANLLLRNLPLAIVARGKFWVNNHAHILKPIRGSIEYLAMLMESLRYDHYITGAAQPKMTAARLMSIPIPVPPTEIQLEIASRLSEQLAQTRSAIELLNREIAVMQEYRTALIADVVTGRKSLRAADRSAP